jgi:hypothetical protein
LDRQAKDAASRRFELMWNRQLQKHEEWAAYRRAFAPSRGRFSVPESEQGRKKNPRRKNSSPFKVAEEFAAGMQSGLVSVSRKWFTFGLYENRMMTVERVKAWISQVEEIISLRMMQTNFYDQFNDFIKEQGVFGTSAMFIEDDDRDIFSCRTMTAGEYAIDVDEHGKVNRFCRKLLYTTQQLADEFGIDALPSAMREELKNRFRRGDDDRHEVQHLIQPNEEYQVDTLGPPGMRYQSLWWLPGHDEPDFLRVSGYNEFPVIVGRWKVIGNDVYGREHPGEVALDDANTLQLLETDARGALERTVRPPMLAPRGLMGPLNNVPNGMTFYDSIAGQAPVVQPLFQVNFDFQSAEQKIQMLIMHIERAFYVDLFRMWASDMRAGRTATEVEAREQEKMYIFSPIALRQTSDVLDPALIRIYGICQRAGILPPAPPDLGDQEIRIEYVSEFALLQKRAAQGGIDTLLYFVERLAQLQAATGSPPEVIDRIDADEIIEVVSSMYGTSAGIVLGDDAAEELRAARAERIQQQQMAATAQAAAEAAPGLAKAGRDMSETPVPGGGSALDAMAGAMSGMGGGEVM